MGPRAFGLPALSVAVLLALACGDELREDEVYCEEAVQRLAECCPRSEFMAQNRKCRFIRTESGCETHTTYPDFSVEESKCILDEGCATLEANGVCARAANGSGRVCP